MENAKDIIAKQVAALPQDADILRAYTFAAQAHEAAGQMRKYSDTPMPYITHPLAVALRVAKVKGVSPERLKVMIISALLHDTVEDTDVTSEQVYSEFGPEVGKMVAGLTDVSTLDDGVRAVRKAMDAAWTAEQDAETQTVKLADVDHNCDSMSRAPRKFAIKWFNEKVDLLKALTKGDTILHITVTAKVQAFLDANVK